MSPSTNNNVLPIKDKDPKFRSLEADVVSAGLPPSKFLPLFRKQLSDTPDPERALNNFLRFVATGFSSSLLKDFFQHPVLLNIALTLFSHSQYLADILVRSPELFHWLTSTTTLTDTKTPEEYHRDAFAVIAPFERVEKKLDALKRFHRREILRISARDILKEADLPAIMRELSWLADSIVDAVVGIGIEDLNRRLSSEIRSTFSVIGLGKLGGVELNFSSDIDLLFVYDRDGELDFGLERIHSYHEYYCRLAEFVVRRLSEHTNEGHLYRVDMRLRPDGAAGPLAMAREAYGRYYETRGELWERQMLLKARVIAGNTEVGGQFLSDLRPFVYPSTVIRDPREEILAIKSRIERGVQDTVNVKLSRGGIRDIEFVVQALQMLRPSGGEALEIPNTMDAIGRLCRVSLLTTRESEQLKQGYTFLRKVEHRLQLLHGIQTHELPVGDEELRLLGRRLGFNSIAAFEKRLAQVQNRVRKIYESVFFAAVGEKHNVSGNIESSPENVKRLILRHGFLEVPPAFQAIEELRKSLVVLDDPGVLTKLVNLLKDSGAPDWGLMNLRILASSDPLRRTIDQVVHNDHMFELVVRLCSRARRLTHQLAQEPLLLEFLLGRTEDIFKPGIEWKFLLKNDPVRFRAFNEGKIIIRYLAGISTLEQSALEFSAVADTVVRSIVEDLQSQYPGFAGNVCIVALGKYGGEEIVVGSDLDLLILAGDSDQQSSEPSLDKAVQDFVRSFSTDAGLVYRIDLRLRPEGKNAPVFADLSYYRQYLEERADHWEKQALLKARVVYEGSEVVGEFDSLRTETLSRMADEPDWLDRIWHMKRKMEKERTSEKSRNTDLKITKGGLVDLEFLIQAVQLRFFSRERSLDVANSFDALERLGEVGIVRKRELQSLRKNYAFLRTLELSIRINSESGQFILPEKKTLAQAIAATVGERSIATLKKRIQDVRKVNRNLLTKVFEEMKK